MVWIERSFTEKRNTEKILRLAGKRAFGLNMANLRQLSDIQLEVSNWSEGPSSEEK